MIFLLNFRSNYIYTLQDVDSSSMIFLSNVSESQLMLHFVTFRKSRQVTQNLQKMRMKNFCAKKLPKKIRNLSLSIDFLYWSHEVDPYNLKETSSAFFRLPLK